MSDIRIGAIVFAIVTVALFIFAVIRKYMKDRRPGEVDPTKLRRIKVPQALTGEPYPSSDKTSYRGIALVSSPHVPEGKALVITPEVVAKALNALDDLTFKPKEEASPLLTETTPDGVQYLLSFTGGSK